MYNVLHVIGHIGRGGDTTVAQDIVTNMDNTKIHFDFVTHKGADKEKVKQFRKAGFRVFVMDGDVRELGMVKYYKSILEIMKNAGVKYDAIHVHTGMQSGVALAAAKKAGIPKRICHSHVTAIQRKASFLKLRRGPCRLGRNRPSDVGYHTSPRLCRRRVYLDRL